jgi:hypothetical protein
MIHKHRSLAPVLLFDLSLTSSRRLGRLFSHSKAPFWTARKRSRFRLLHSDYPLYFMSIGSLRLIPGKHVDEDHLYLRTLDAYEATMHSTVCHPRTIGAPTKLEHVSVRGTVGPNFGRNQQPSGSHVSTRFSRWLKQFFGVSFVRFRVGVRGAVCDCQLLKFVRFPVCGPSCLAHRLWSEFVIKRPGLTAILQDLLACALRRHPKTNGTGTHQNLYRKGVHPCTTAEDTYASNRCSQPKNLACPSTPILRT